jgi:predicted metal-dependent HD superfamily phosphohydrolase
VTGIAAAWDGAVTTLGGVPGDSAADLLERYAEPHRGYHTGAHIEAVLADVAWLSAQLGLDVRDRALVELAACAHDVVYDARPGDDERASATWAVGTLTSAGLGAADVARVEALVLATLAHRADPEDLVAAVLLDADLAILAAAPDAYAAYVAGVRREYAVVPDEAWRTGRASVLESLVARADLYLSEPARTRWDAAARRNVAAELATLRGHAG